MAQLPPKAPSMASNWQDFSHQRIPSMECLPTNTTNGNPLWVDEFLDFSSVKRGPSHKRSVSDSVAFLEMPALMEANNQHCRRSSAPETGNTSSEFERFDDEQLMYMFTDDVPMSVGPAMSISNPSSPSDHNSIDDHNGIKQMKQLKSEGDEVQSSCHPATNDYSTDKIFDPKRIKRILANRQSAQRSRVRKLQYISELERSVTSLQAEVSVLSPRVAFLDHQRMVLTLDNGALKQRIAALAQDKIFKDAHQEALKREIERLRQIYYQHNMKKMEDSTISHPKPAAMDTNGLAEKEQLVVN